MIVRQLFVLFLCFAMQILATDFIRLPFKPFITGDFFRSKANYLYDETNSNLDPKLVKENDIIFVRSDKLKDFFKKIHPHIVNKYILISHNSDEDISYNYFTDYNLETIKIWLAQNLLYAHDKIIPIPIGLENRYCGIKKYPIFYESYKKKCLGIKKNLVYLNCNPGTCLKERSRVYSIFKDCSYCKTVITPINYCYFLNDILSSHFVLCPRGNGLDTVRLWETLYLGSIPIVKSSGMDSLLCNLPVLIIDDWTDINEPFLIQKMDEIKSKKYNLDFLYTDYWEKLIDFYKKN